MLIIKSNILWWDWKIPLRSKQKGIKNCRALSCSTAANTWCIFQKRPARTSPPEKKLMALSFPSLRCPWMPIALWCTVPLPHSTVSLALPWADRILDLCLCCRLVSVHPAWLMGSGSCMIFHHLHCLGRWHTFLNLKPNIPKSATIRTPSLWNAKIVTWIHLHPVLLWLLCFRTLRLGSTFSKIRLGSTVSRWSFCSWPWAWGSVSLITFQKKKRKKKHPTNQEMISLKTSRRDYMRWAISCT